MNDINALRYCNPGINREVAANLLSLFAQYQHANKFDGTSFIPSPCMWDEVFVLFDNGTRLLPIAFYATRRKVAPDVLENANSLRALVQDAPDGEWVIIRDAEGADFDLGGRFGQWVFLLNNSGYSINTIQSTLLSKLDGNLLVKDVVFAGFKAYLSHLPAAWQLAIQPDELIFR